jgi:hypothetical protein
MARRAGSRRVATWLTVVLSAAFAALVIYRSLHAAGYRCEVCIQFDGRSACRTVEGPTELEARSGAINNTCAQLASGVTDSMACERTTPYQASCAAIP